MTDHDNDEKGFNDDELKDIMEEIESLEKEFTDEPSGTSDGYIDSKSEDIQEEVEKEVDNILDGDIDMSSSKKSIHSTVKKFPMKSSMPHGKSKMHFSVEGEMNIQLSFDVAGKVINLYVDENEGLVIEMNDGVKFSIPVSSKAA